MPSGRLSDTRFLVAAGIAIVVLAATAAFLAPRQTPRALGPSSFSTAGFGGKAAFLTLQDLGYDVERSFEPVTALRVEPRETVLVITGPVSPSEQDKRAMRRFLTSGGTALLIGAQGAEFLGIAGGSGPAALFGAVETHRAVAVSPIARGAMEITMPSPEEAPRFRSEWVSVFAQGDASLVATAAVESGRVIWLAAATPLTNLHIRNAGNLQLLLNVVGPPDGRQILWDEHYHGHTRSLWSYAVNTPLPWMGLQVGLLTLAAFAAYSRRRGPVRARPVEVRTSAMEFVETLRALYQRANASSVAVASARDRLRRTIATISAVPIDSADEELARAAALKRLVSSEEVVETLVLSRRAAADPDLTASAARTLCARLQELSLRLTTVRRLSDGG